MSDWMLVGKTVPLADYARDVARLAEDANSERARADTAEKLLAEAVELLERWVWFRTGIRDVAPYDPTRRFLHARHEESR